MNTDTVINPYKLLGINPYNPCMDSLKKNFRTLALICHPDKGGSEQSMRTLYNAYIYIKYQFQNCETNRKSFEELEQEFEMFCKNQEKKHPKNFSKKNVQRKNFNKMFEEQKQKEKNTFNKGYGKFMSNSDYANGKLTYDNNNIKKKNKYKFENIDNTALSIYKEPQSFLQSYGNHERFDIKNISDFSYSTGELSMSDYEKAFKIIGEKNVNKVSIKPRSYKNYIKQRALDKQNYKVSKKKHSVPKEIFKFYKNEEETTSTDSSSTYDSSSDLD